MDEDCPTPFTNIQPSDVIHMTIDMRCAANTGVTTADGFFMPIIEIYLQDESKKDFDGDRE